MQVVTEAYMAHDVHVPQHQLMSLILCKIGDSDKASCPAMFLQRKAAMIVFRTC